MSPGSLPDTKISENAIEECVVPLQPEDSLQFSAGLIQLKAHQLPKGLCVEKRHGSAQVFDGPVQRLLLAQVGNDAA